MQLDFMVSSLYLMNDVIDLLHIIDSYITSISSPLLLFTHAIIIGTLADEGNGMIGRDGTRYTNETRESANDYAETWQVNEMIDGKLFNSSSTQTCIAPPYPNLDTNAALAEAACVDLSEGPEDFYRNCLFDVAVTGDPEWATTPIYTEGSLGDMLEAQEQNQCVDNNNECADRGGSCIFRCNEEVFDCVQGLCQASDFTPLALFPPPNGYVEGCSCAFEISPTNAPTNPKFCVNHCFLAILQILFGWLLWLFGTGFCRLW